MQIARKASVSVLSGLLTLAPCRHVQAPSTPSQPTELTDLAITTTPEIRALCLSGSGDSSAYSAAMTKLLEYVNANSISTKGFAFGDNWKPGENSDSPASGATWEVCVESSAPDNVASNTFVFQDLKPQDAAYGVCTVAPENLSKCFAGLEAFVDSKHYHPVAMPRYAVKNRDEKNNKNVYEFWLPVGANPNSTAEPPK